MHHLYFEKHCCSCCHRSSIQDLDDESAMKTKEQKAQKRKHPIVRFFIGPYFRFVTHKVARWFIIVLFTAFLAFCIWSATRIESSTESIQFYRQNTIYGKASELGEKFVPSGDHFVNMYLVWGLKPTDFSECHFTDFRCDGLREYDEVFDMNTPPAQTALKDLCDMLKTGLSSDEVAKLHIKNNSNTGQLEVDCFMDDMQEYLLDEQEDIAVTSNISLDLTYPLLQDNIMDLMDSKPKIYDTETLGRQFYRYFEIGLSYYMSLGYSMLTHAGYLKYDRFVGEARDDPFTQPARIHYNLTNGTGPFGFYGTKLRYAAIRINLTLANNGLAYKKGIPVFDDWDTFLQDQMAIMPASLRHGFPVTDFNWHWLIIQQTLEQGAWMGMGISIAVACVVLILATMNIIVGLLATLLIGGVTAGVLGIIPLAGWKIDVMISMNLTLLVGLSVDYIVHIAEGYHLSDHEDRLNRVRDMLEALGISILNGAVTTLGAAFFMLFSKITFFFQFGTFLFCIIGFSMAYSLVFFPAVMSVIGPEGNTGSIITPFKKLHYKVIGRKKEDVRCSDCKGKGFRKPSKDEAAEILPNSEKDALPNVYGMNGPFSETEITSGETKLANGSLVSTPDNANVDASWEEVAHL